MNTISPAQLYERFQRGEPIELLDVRTPAEFRAVHVSFAHNAPLERLDPSAILKARNGRGERPLYVVCHSGTRGAKACAALAAAGCRQVFNVEGGTQACIAAGLPVERGKRTISIERQVRIVAGALVLVGSTLGYFVHPYFTALAAFVGAGLLFAGVTNTCGMATLLARMPWNQTAVDTPSTNTCNHT